MIDNFIIENDTYRILFPVYELIERRDGIYPIGGTLSVGEDMVKHPARFIQYCCSNLPIPSMFFDGSSKNWETVDGNKRLRTIFNFIENKFPLEDGRYFKDIEGYMRSFLKNASIEAYVITSGAKDKELIKKYIKEL